MVTLDGDVLARYPRVSLYNSPYPAHDTGCAVDLYPQTARAPSPVAGDVVETRTVRCPSKPYAVDHDHLIVVDTGDFLARILHVAPAVEAGDTVVVGDDLGRMVRSGFFAPWVDNHVHLGFRERDGDAVRASGSLPLDLDAPVEPVSWDGTGEVVETGGTYALLDAPEHHAPGECFAGIAIDDGRVLDGGVPHYEGGGVFGQGETDDSVSFLGTHAGDVADGRTVAWRDVTVTANGEPVRGLSLWLGIDRLGVKLVAPEHDLAVGDSVTVGVE
ncbi:hypothetical protein [Halobacterium noricense]|uniref:hypothetical protein n=1 Tax=Halobacterium noricense TaxID=223182 RepID=UPI001E65CB54|nr:hypothetical protein [Halobacterium noricense]UHH25264.1 hypothetical protein LT974_14965 [Halobacterium noricense]